MLAAAVLAAGGARAVSLPAASDTSALVDALRVVQDSYVDRVPFERLAAGALKGALEALDPHSQYLSPDQYRETQLEVEGAFVGVGLELAFRDGLPRVVAPLDGSPAAEAGLRPADAVLRVDGRSTRGLTLGQVVERIGGASGSLVTLSIERDGLERPLDVTLERRRVRIESVSRAELLPGGIGYVRISTFRQSTPGELERALEDLSGRGMQKLVVDVRSNSGGPLGAAVDAAAVFVPQGAPIVYTRGRDGRTQERVPSPEIKRRPGIPLAVLIDGGSASSAEVFAAAVRDHGAGILVGSRTYGKGSVQTLIPLPGGGALRLTTSRFLRPSQLPIQDEGVAPDIEVVSGPPTWPAPDGPLARACEALGRG